MKMINREIGYAIKALCFMVIEEKDIATTSQMAAYFKISRPFLRKILQKLNKVGLLESHKGKNGGFKLALPISEIFLIDLIKIFQGPIKLSGCYKKDDDCPLIAECPIMSEIERLEKNFIADLAKISLKTIVEKKQIEEDQDQ